MPYTPEQIQKRYDRLPADIRTAIDSVSTTNTIVDIGQKYDLMYDQISELVDEVGLVMVGLTPSAMFVNNIARRMQVDTGKAMLVARDINNEIFDKMRDSLKKIEGDDEESYSNESVDTVPKKEEVASEPTLTAAEKAQKESVVSAVEKAGGFVIEKPDQAPLKAEEMVNEAIKEKLESKKDIINILEKESFEPKSSIDTKFNAKIDVKVETPLPPDRLLGDTPEIALSAQNDAVTKNAEKKADQTSIVDTLLSHGVAMTMDSGPSQQEKKVKPYDGTDPYREATN